MADRPRIQEAVRDIVTNTCRAYGCDGQVTIIEGEPALVNDPALAAASWPWARRGGFAIDDNFRSCGADDFSYYLTTAPTLMLFVGTHDDITLHNPRFLPPDESVGEVASAMLAGYLAALTRLPALRPGSASALGPGPVSALGPGPASALGPGPACHPHHPAPAPHPHHRPGSSLASPDPTPSLA